MIAGILDDYLIQISMLSSLGSITVFAECRGDERGLFIDLIIH